MFPPSLLLGVASLILSTSALPHETERGLAVPLTKRNPYNTFATEADKNAWIIEQGKLMLSKYGADGLSKRAEGFNSLVNQVSHTT